MKKKLAELAKKTRSQVTGPSADFVKLASNEILHEDQIMGTQAKLLTEPFPIRLSLSESEEGKVIAKGEFGRCDVPTQNGRIYPRKIMEREIDKLRPLLGSKRLFGELDHSNDGKTKLTRASHVITKLEIDDDGKVMGEAEILDTPNGKTLKALLQANCEVGVSSRAFGSTIPGTNGETVGEDLILKSYDFVADPSVRTAYPEIFMEDVNTEMDPVSLISAEFPEELKKIEAAAFERGKQTALEDKQTPVMDEQARKEAIEKVERTIAEQVAGVRDAVAKEIRKEYLADPQIGAARGMLAQIAEMVMDYYAEPDEKAIQDALKAKDLELATLTKKLEDTQSKVGRYEMRLHLERSIGGKPMAESIRALMKGIEQTVTMEDYKKRLETVITEISAAAPKPENMVSEEEAGRRVESERLTKENERLVEKVDDLREKLKKAIEIGEKLDAVAKDAQRQADEFEEKVEDLTGKASAAELKAYKAESVAGLTNSRELFSLLEGVSDKEAVRKIVQEQGTKTMSDPVLEQMRAKIRRARTVTPTRNLEEEAAISVSEKGLVDGQSIVEQQRLAGLRK